METSWLDTFSCTIFKKLQTNRCFRYAVVFEVDKSDRMKDIHQLSAQFLPVGQLLTQINHWNVACTGTVRYEQWRSDGGGHIDVSNWRRKNRSKMSKCSWIDSCWKNLLCCPNQWDFKNASVRKLVKKISLEIWNIPTKHFWIWCDTVALLFPNRTGWYTLQNPRGHKHIT